jgi:putative peptidoglycan lipid II flippase
MEFPLGVFSIALATVILPGLAQHHAHQSLDRFSATLDWAVRLTLLLATPAAVALLVLAGPLTATMFGYGKFDSRSVVMASYALMAYSWGLLGFSLVKVLAPGYFARQDTRTPVRIALIALAVNMTLNLVVVLPAKWLGFPAPHALLATSTCVSAAVNTTLLWRGLQRAKVWLPAADFWPVVARIVIANLVMAAVLAWLAGDLPEWLAASPLHRAARLAGCIAVGAIVYFLALFAVGLRYHDFRTRVVARTGGTVPISSPP